MCDGHVRGVDKLYRRWMGLTKQVRVGSLPTGRVEKHTRREISEGLGGFFAVAGDISCGATDFGECGRVAGEHAGGEGKGCVCCCESGGCEGGHEGGDAGEGLHYWCVLVSVVCKDGEVG